MGHPDDLEAQTGKASVNVDAQDAEEDLPPTTAEKRRIRYIDDQDEISPSARVQSFGSPLTRRASTYSIHSMRSVRSQGRTIDPSVALPIQYRTVSFNIEEGEKAAKAQDAKGKVVQQLGEVDWHLMSEAEICKNLETSTDTGLSDADVKAKVAKYGRNVPSKPPSQIGRKLFGYCFGGFGSILLIGAILVFITWKPLGEPDPQQANLALAIVLVAVFAIQALFNAWQDFSSSRVMNSITGMLPEECNVLRNGVKLTIMAPDVVPGDIMYFKAGNKLPADIRFVEVSSDAKFDRSILTGESLPLAAVTQSTDNNYLETKCIGMQGTSCTSGSGVGIVVAIGDKTVFGHIAKLTSTPSTAQTPLQKEIVRFVLIIVGLMVTMNVIVLAVWGGYIRKNYPDFLPPAALIVAIVSVAIAFVPEGLPIALTASLTIVANIMRKNNILCKSLKTVETLGAVSVLLSDKTGTLTKNQMVATDALIGLTTMTATEAVEEYIDAEKPSSKKTAIEQLRVVAAICNAGEFDPTTNDKPLAERRIIADATDQAVLRLSASLAPVQEARSMWRKRFDLAFNSKNKFAIRVSSSNHNEASNVALSKEEAARFDQGNDMFITMKGAPDVLMPRCTRYVGEDGEVHGLDEGVRATIESVKDQWSAAGKRVLLLARKVVSLQDLRHDPADGDFEQELLTNVGSSLILVGIVGIVDPPREEVPNVIETLRNAGIRTMMVTGDFKLTAQAIARMCGIITCPDEQIHSFNDLLRATSRKSDVPEAETSRGTIVISGPELITLNATQWESLTQYREVVFARTTPDQKLRIVKEFKSRGNIVAMTGDGVNDAPSLKEADIGIAPGSGSDIALEAADMVLLDSFSAIVEAVLYGRVVYDNLKKTIAYLLPAGSFSEFWPVMTSVVFGLPQVLSSFLMIIICCFTDCAAATVLAYEKPEADVLFRPPRDVRKDKLVDWRLLIQSYGLVGVVETFCSFAMSYWYLSSHGVPFSSLWFSFGNIQVPGNMSQEELSNLLATASSIYFVNLVVMQWFVIFALRTRRLSIFQHPPLFNKKTQNWLLFPAILFALVIAFIFNYIPSLDSVIQSAEVPVAHWFLPMAFGLFVLSMDELRKAACRRWPKSIIAKAAW